MTDGNKLGVAVIGLGIGAQHARAYLGTGRCNLLWLYDVDHAKSKHLCRELGEGQPARDFEEIIGDSSVHAVSIASFDDDHYWQICQALAAGKHVFVEKPLCRNIDELKEVKDAWQTQGGNLKLVSNLVLRGAPLYRWLKDRINCGEMGTIYAMDGDYLYGRLHKLTGGWRKDQKNYSIMLGGGIHLVDLALWLTGERPVSAWASGNQICTERTGFNNFDYVCANLKFPSGMIMRVSVNTGCVHYHQHVLKIYGTNITFLYDDAGPRLHLSREPESHARFLNFHDDLLFLIPSIFFQDHGQYPVLQKSF